MRRTAERGAMLIVGEHLRAHPQREALAHEVHARPFEPMTAPERGSHVAMIEAADAAPQRHVAQLCARYSAPVPEAGANFYSQDLGPFRLRWEHHTEFSTYTFMRRGTFRHPFERPILELVPKDWLAALPGEALGAVHFALEPRTAPERSQEELSMLFYGNQVIGSGMSGGNARAYSDLRLHDDGFSRLLVRDRSLSKLQAGRLVQRLLEINAYRQLTLLALPLARELAPRIHALDVAVGKITAELADSPRGGEKRLLDDLSERASDLEKVGALASYRFTATRAYFDIVQSRLHEIRQQRIQGLQTFSEFLERRLVPAVNYCFSTAERIERLADRVSRLGSLLRARVQVQMEEQNRDLLASMDRRANLQFRLQRVVEGVSLVAATYYVVGVIDYAVQGLAAFGVPVGNPAVVTALAVPAVAALAWGLLAAVRRSLRSRDE